jgi:hypothetical protein
MYPHSQEWHQNREETVYVPALSRGHGHRRIRVAGSYAALALTTTASSAIAGGAISPFLALFVPMAFEHFGVPVNIHDSAGIVLMAFGTIARVRGHTAARHWSRPDG